MVKYEKTLADAHQDGPQGGKRNLEFPAYLTLRMLARQRGIPGDNSAASQRARILQHLQEVRPLAKLQARHHLDVMHSGMRVCELRKKEFSILTFWCQDVTLEAGVHRVAKYSLRRGSHKLPLAGVKTPKGGA